MKEYKAKKLEIKRADEEAYKKLEKDYKDLIAEKDKQIIKEERKEDEWRGYCHCICHCICPCMFKKTENDIRKKIAKNIIIKEEIEVIMDMRKQLKKDIKSPNLSE